jgi:hypothetical protein
LNFSNTNNSAIAYLLVFVIYFINESCPRNFKGTS